MWKSQIIEEACKRFQGTIRSLRLLGGFYNHVYEFEHNGKPYVLKLYPIASKEKNRLLSELKWSTFIRSHGLLTPQPLLSEDGEEVEMIIKLPIPCCAISMEKMNGKKLQPNLTEWNARLFRRWGQAMGKLHSLSLPFHHREKSAIFDEWDEGEIYHRDLTFIQPNIVDRWVLLLNKISSLPKTPQSYGLIHNDFTPNGILLTQAGSITLYDFSKVKYHWFTYDIAIAVYHAMDLVAEEEREAFQERFLQSFIEGYLMEHPLPSDWNEQIQLFLEYRQLFLYLYMMSYLDLKHASTESLEYLEKLKYRILSQKKVRL